MKKKIWLPVIMVPVLGCVLFDIVNALLGGFLSGAISYHISSYINPIEFSKMRAGTIPEGQLTYDAYEIDPATILINLRNGKMNVFSPINGEPRVRALITPDSTPSGTYPWEQADYLLVAEAIHQTNKSESLEGWQLHGMEFTISNCHDNPNGFDVARFIYFKDDMTTHTVSAMDMYPLYQVIQWGDPTYPRYENWYSYNLSAKTLTAEDALRIAEDNGGRQARQEAGNRCNIRIDLSRVYEERDIWSVHYNWSIEEKHGSIFAIDMDANTGEFKIR